MKKYTTVEEITTAFIKKGWSKDITFAEFTKSLAREKGYDGIEAKMNKGKKFFIMLETGNVYDENGKVAMYNIPAALQTNE